jgi:DNA-directed RNA polymerase I, II, and III subunit RPABC3
LVQDELELNGDGTGAGAGDEDAPKKVKRELWRSEDQGLAADYEYVMYGKVCTLFWRCQTIHG